MKINPSYDTISSSMVRSVLLDPRCSVAPLPPALKHQVILSYHHSITAAHGPEISCIETGTLNGDTTEFLSSIFKKVITIEAFEPLYQKAEKRFIDKLNVQTLFGDSGELIEEAISQCPNDQPILFFLDAHFSGEGTGKGKAGSTCPTFNELFAIQKLRNLNRCVILIDDMRNFGNPQMTHYPNQEYVREWGRMNRLQARVSSDIIQLADPVTATKLRQLYKLD